MSASGRSSARSARAEALTADVAGRSTLVALWSAAAPLLLLDTVCPADFELVRQATAQGGMSRACAQLLRLRGRSPVLAGWVAQNGDAAALPESGLSADGIAHVTGAIVDALSGQAVPDATRTYLDRAGLGNRLDPWMTQTAEAVDRAA